MASLGKRHWYLAGVFVFVIVIVDYGWILKNKRQTISKISALMNDSINKQTLAQNMMMVDIKSEGPAIPRLLDVVAQHARHSKVNITALQLGDLRAQLGHFLLPIHCQCVTNFHHLAKFIEGLTRYPIGIELHEFRIKRIKTKRKQQPLLEDGFLHIDLKGVIKFFSALEAHQYSLPVGLQKQLEGICKTKLDYLAAKVRDPFLSPKEDTRPSGILFSIISKSKRRGHIQSLAPLEQFPLAQLSLVGTVKMNHKVWALIRDSYGHTHLASLGDRLGHQHGKIATIKEDMVYIEETMSDEGNRIPYRSVLKLEGLAGHESEHT